MNGFESLHNHTLDSDGKQSHIEMLHDAERLGYGVMAITDHDQLPSEETLARIKKESFHTRWVLGIEISSDVPKELEDHSSLHILGLFVDPDNQALRNHCQQMAKSRVERMQRMVHHLNSLGFQLTTDECLTESGNDFVGSPHIVSALLKHSKNRKLMEEIRLKMEIAAKTDEEIAFRYKRMLAEGERQLPYVLFMKTTSYLPMPKTDEESWNLLDLDESVRLIREAGGIAMLAHWWFDKKKLPLQKVDELVKSKRLDGLETAVVNLITLRDVTAESELMENIARKYQAAEVVGADAHDNKDLEAFAASKVGAGSPGQTELLIKQYSPDLKWSNYATV